MPGKEWWILKSWSGWEETSWEGEGENNQLKESINPGDRNLPLTQQASTEDNTSILRSPEEPPFANRLVRDRLSLCWHWKLNQLLKKNTIHSIFFRHPKAPITSPYLILKVVEVHRMSHLRMGLQSHFLAGMTLLHRNQTYAALTMIFELLLRVCSTAIINWHIVKLLISLESRDKSPLLLLLEALRTKGEWNNETQEFVRL